MTTTVHVLDASPFLFRAHFALPDMRGPRDQPVSAAHGYGAFLLRWLTDERPTHVFVAFDEALSSGFRHEIDPGYKASREPPPEELLAQFAACRALTRALGLAESAHPRFEADDLIATVTRRFADAGHRVEIISGDKDLLQLVGPDVVLNDVVRGRRWSAADVQEHYGVSPGRFVDLQGLAGDPVDDIKGVTGIGLKTAAALLAHADDLEALYADLEAVATWPLRGAAGVARKLDAGRDQAFLSRRLATLSLDVPGLPDEPDALAWQGALAAPLQEVCDELGFRSLPRRVPRWHGPAPAGV